MTTKPFIVGITGGSASGKTSFLKGVINAFTDDQICLISQDNYYLSRDVIPVDDQGVHNFDLPETIDHHLYARAYWSVHAGESDRYAE